MGIMAIKLTEEERKKRNADKKIMCTIRVKPSAFTPDFIMIVDVPITEDKEEYINDLLESFVKEESFYNLEWDFE